jgi:hypothetical protein
MRAFAVVLALSLVAAIGCSRRQPPPPPAAAPGHGGYTGPGAPPTAAPAAVTAPGQLPSYANSTQMKQELEGPDEGYSRVVETEHVSNDSFDAVVAFYQAAITQGGWQVLDTEQKPGQVEWRLGHGPGIVVELEIETESALVVRIKKKRMER